MSARILSTKILNPGQKELLLNAGLHVVEQNFISIVPLQFELDQMGKNIIFTSRNAVKAVLDHPKIGLLQEKPAFCVGDKIADLLQKSGFRVLEKADYGKDLAEKIISGYSRERFTFFCGKKRNPALPQVLKRKAVSFTEIEVYDTRLSPKKIDCIFDAVLFFSPSAVKSYFSVNDFPESTAFCIGETTASEAKKHTPNIIIASTPSVENVIVKVIKHFKRY